ncbi:MAG TPA: polysaccharide biosynthesis tyrosine autokinase [Opitutaceae bacterium]|nr:polysaccharide biosynthesis tyrosine autokinase [Opitutaceae bacterium]
MSGVSERPQAAALLANRFAEQAIEYVADRSRSSTDASLVFLRGQAEDLRKKSETAERALQAYRTKYNLVSLDANQNIIVDNLKSLNASATAARVARVGIEARLDQAQTVLKRGDGAAEIAAITGADTLGDIARRLADLKGKRAVMSERYGRRHPLMEENERAIEALQKLEDQEVATAMAALADQRDKARAEERQLDLQRAKAEQDALNLDQRAVEYNILRSTMETHKATYAQLLARLNDATISSQLADTNMRISELATPPAAPFSPNLRKTALVALGLALAILIGYPFTAEMFFGRVRSSADVEYHLSVDLIGEIGSVRGVDERNRAKLVTSEEDEAAAEQFRALYSQLTLTSKIDPPKSILVTSTMPGEGKSFIAANLAECFVAHSRRTLLFDADLRRPTQHRNFGMDNKSGVIRWLESGGSGEGDLLKNPHLGIAEAVPGLYLLRAGGVSRKATELMDAPQLPALLAAIQRQFDVVIFDTPPAGVFPDALAFAKMCHEIVYICRFNAAARRAVHDIVSRLKQTELEFTGIVLNAMPSGLGGSYYYRGYSYQQAKRYSKEYATTPRSNP